MQLFSLDNLFNFKLLNWLLIKPALADIRCKGKRKSIKDRAMHCYNYELNLNLDKVALFFGPNCLTFFSLNPIRMYCSNCFIEMETRVERVNRWYGPIAAQWNKMLVLIGMVSFLFVHFLFGFNQENFELIFTPVARFGIKGTSCKILRTCPNCDYQNTTYLSYLRFHRMVILLENIWTMKSLKNVETNDEQSLH